MIVIATNEANPNYGERMGQCRTCIAALLIGVCFAIARNDVVVRIAWLFCLSYYNCYSLTDGQKHY